jgi:hypothetical protein
MKKPMKFKRYNGEDGSEVEESKAKKRGLDISNKDAPMGFFERLRMGNIDDPTSEAYKRLGAGRGRSEAPAEKAESAPEAPAKIIPRPSIQMRPAERALSDDMYSDYGSKTGMGAAGESYSTQIRPANASRPSNALNLPPLPAMTKYPETESAKNKPVVSKPTVKKEVGESVSVNEPTSKREVGESVSVNEPRVAKTPNAPKTSSSRVPTSEQAAANRSAAVEKVKGVGSSIADYFRNYETPAERKARERKEKAAKGSYASGGSVSSASRRADGIATKGKTRGKMC